LKAPIVIVWSSSISDRIGFGPTGEAAAAIGSCWTTGFVLIV